MIKTDKIRKPQPAVFYIIDYLWSGFAGLGVAMVVVALWAWGSAVFGEFMLPEPVEVFQKSLDLLKHFQENEIGISLWRSVVGISVALVAGLAAGLVAGSFKTAMALLKPVITVLLPEERVDDFTGERFGDDAFGEGVRFGACVHGGLSGGS